MTQKERRILQNYITENKFCKDILQPFKLLKKADTTTVYSDPKLNSVAHYSRQFIDKYTVQENLKRRKSILFHSSMDIYSIKLFNYIECFIPIDAGCIILNTNELSIDLDMSRKIISRSIKILVDLNVLDKVNFRPAIYCVNPNYAFRGNLKEFLITHYSKHLKVKKI